MVKKEILNDNFNNMVAEKYFVRYLKLMIFLKFDVCPGSQSGVMKTLTYNGIKKNQSKTS